MGAVFLSWLWITFGIELYFSLWNNLYGSGKITFDLRSMFLWIRCNKDVYSLSVDFVCMNINVMLCVYFIIICTSVALFRCWLSSCTEAYLSVIKNDSWWDDKPVDQRWSYKQDRKCYETSALPAVHKLHYCIISPPYNNRHSVYLKKN